MKSRGQMTVFIILGVVVLVILLLGIVFYNQGNLTVFLKETQRPVPYYVDECMKFNIVDGSVILTSQGGFIYNYDPNVSTTKRTFAYSIHNGENTSPSYEFMQNELARYIEENIDACIDESPFILQKNGTPRARVKIYPERIYAELDYVISTQVGDSLQTYDEFAASHDVPLGRMLQLRDEVVTDMLEYPNLMILDKLYATDFEMIINPYSGSLKIIEMINKSARLRNNPLTFTFAVHKEHSLPEKLKFSKMPPDMSVKVGLPMTAQAICNHHCNFYDDTIFFDIDEKTGVINYLPDPLDVGEHNITLTITDETYTVYDTFKMVVLP